MGKDELIEALAAGYYDGLPTYGPPSSHRIAFSQIDESDKEVFRNAGRWAVPVIVEFVADWLEQASCEDFNHQYPAQIWREDMGAPAPERAARGAEGDA